RGQARECSVLKSSWHESSRCRPREGGDPYAAARRCRTASDDRNPHGYGSPPSRGRQRRVIALHLSKRGRRESGSMVAQPRLRPFELGFPTLADQKERPGRADALDVGCAALLEYELIGRKGAERLAHLDAAGLAIGLHARGGVHRIAPHIVGE